MSAADHILLQFFSEDNVNGVAYKNKMRKREIINYLDIHGDATINELAQAMNISPPKATILINELIEVNLIQDYGKIDALAGRPASKYGLIAEAGFFVGVDVHHNYINFGILDLKKNLVSSSMKVPYALDNTKEARSQLITLIKNFIKKALIDSSNILSLCINLSGRINTNSGYSYSYFHFEEEPLAAIIEKKIGIKTFLENDSRAMAYGEFLKGIVKNEKNVLFVNMDYGIGLGVLINGKVYYGKSGYSGEFGHIPLFDNEIICHCGKKGCLETEASGSALLRNFKTKVGQGSSSSIVAAAGNLSKLKLWDIIEGVRNEDVLSIDLLAEVGEKMGRGLAVLINLFNAEMVILGGTLASTGDYIYLPIKSAINKYSLSLVNNDTTLCLSLLGEKAGVIGGALIARNKLLFF